MTKKHLGNNNVYAQVNSKLVQFMMEIEKEYDITIAQWLRLFSHSIIFLAKNLEEHEE